MEIDDEGFIEENITDLFTRLGGTGFIGSLEIYKANLVNVLKDVASDPYTRIFFNKKISFPMYGRLKLRYELREQETERDITIILTLTLKNGRVLDSYYIDIQALDTLENEADVNKIVDPKKLENSTTMVEENCKVLISLLNSLLQSKIIKVYENDQDMFLDV